MAACTEKTRGPPSVFPYQKGGQQLFYLSSFEGNHFLLTIQSHGNLCHCQRVKINSSKLPETPILKILSGNTVYLGLFKWGKERGARSFFECLDMGANTFFEVSKMGAMSLFRG